MDCGGIPVPLCIQIGNKDTPLRCKVVGPTLGFIAFVGLAVVCWPAALFCGCCASESGKKMLATPGDSSAALTGCIPF